MIWVHKVDMHTFEDFLLSELDRRISCRVLGAWEWALVAFVFEWHTCAQTSVRTNRESFHIEIAFSLLWKRRDHFAVIEMKWTIMIKW